ncbi:hypothetical protein VFPFJ_01361 [Purpureocillium lilacinum]|uniref:Uncharacterized protein n=1 Tax=Purpureocillium lilacinum TaxID=33203 RepID=A0A179HZC8_PURLI|nr:hypothetical protein VFPFJ_01361 [Purpureocillium lilacinum]OAQ95252.1 hypothetical protein VFPFJ_01361 [Purpureocillium lilacinum]
MDRRVTVTPPTIGASKQPPSLWANGCDEHKFLGLENPRDPLAFRSVSALSVRLLPVRLTDDARDMFNGRGPSIGTTPHHSATGRIPYPAPYLEKKVSPSCFVHAAGQGLEHRPSTAVPSP